MTKDPYMIDVDEHKKLKEESKGASLGISCPKRNKAIGKLCAVCDKVSYLFGTGDQQDREIALSKMAKVNYYMNVVFPHNPNKAIVLEVGKKVGNDIIQKIDNGKWLDIAHPKAGLGREMEISKSKGDMGYNTYDASPVLDKADWDIPDEVLQNLVNLDNIIDIYDSLSEEGGTLFKISSLKLDETLTFRICPPAKDAKRRIMTPIWRHWGVTQDEVDGKIEMNLSFPNGSGNDKAKVTEEPAPWDEPNTKTTEQTVTKTTEQTIEQPAKSAPVKLPCFGKSNFFDVSDKICVECEMFKPCVREVAKEIARLEAEKAAKAS